MNELQVFNFNNNQVRTLLIDNEPWFVGKDVATVLGYKDASSAILDHIDEEDRVNSKTQGCFSVELGQRGSWVINESGLYSLILSSKMPQAKKFKRWVTSEVLPSIRKTGAFKLPTNPMEILKVTYDALKDTNEKVSLHDQRITELEENKYLSPGEYNYISKAVKNKVKNIITDLNFELSKKQKNKVYSSINRDLNQFVGVRTRSQFKAKHFDKAIDFIQDYQLSYTDLKIIQQIE